MKALEDIIKDTGETLKFTIGIDCQANNYYNDTTKKYDMEGFKQPPDADQLIEFYIKYLSEHPMITLLEDPIADMDRQGWNKIYQKFEGNKNITITAKNIIDESLSNLKNVTEHLELEETFDYMSEEERMKISHSNKFKKEENLNKIQLSNISLRIGDSVNLSELVECFKYANGKLSNSEKRAGITVWDNAYENETSQVIDVALGMRANNIILHGICNRAERVNKINRYLDLITDLY